MKGFLEFINEEAGLRNVSKVFKNYENMEIYFHKDLDGVTTALAMRDYLERRYNIKMVDCHITQYGSLEHAVKEISPGNLAVLVDFAHGKPMFHIHTDHHQEQTGSEHTKSTYFKPARSNAETVSNLISYSPIFMPNDLKLIQTVDSADFYRNNITPDDVQRSIFTFNREMTGEKNRFFLGFVVNRLLLSYKNKRITVTSLNGKNRHENRNILECLVIDSEPSIYSIYNNIIHYIKNATTRDRLGRLATQEEITKNLEDYIKRMRDYSFVEDEEGEVYHVSRRELMVLKKINNKRDSDLYDLAKELNINFDDIKDIIDSLMNKQYIYKNDKYNKYYLGGLGKKVSAGKKTFKGVHLDSDYNILIQYGGGNMLKPGSYDRYTPFKNYPETDFLCIVWPMGLIQVSCNPFKDKILKDINLGDVQKSVLSFHKNKLNDFYITLESIKREYETSQDWKKMIKEEGEDVTLIGFKFSDLEAFYHDCIYLSENQVVDIKDPDKEYSIYDNKVGSIDFNKEIIMNAMSTDYEKLSFEQKTVLENLAIPAWEIIDRNSGGHPSITNISGFNILNYDKPAMIRNYNTDKYTIVMKQIAREMVEELKRRIDIYKGSGEEVSNIEYGIDENKFISGNIICNFKNFNNF